MHHGHRQSWMRPCFRPDGVWLFVLPAILPEDPCLIKLCRDKINLNEISHNSAMGIVRRMLDIEVLLTELKVHLNTESSCQKNFQVFKFVVSKKSWQPLSSCYWGKCSCQGEHCGTEYLTKMLKICIQLLDLGTQGILILKHG